MKRRTIEVRRPDGTLEGYFVKCPACEADDGGSGHLFAVKMGDGSPGWSFDGNFERPTFAPSMLARSLIGSHRRELRCHSFVRNGNIEYLGDCTHAMKGQTIPLPEFDDE